MELPARPPPLAERLALRVLQTGALLSVLLVVPYAPFELDRFSVPKELALHVAACLAGLLMIGAARRLRPTRVDLLLAAFLVASALSALLAQNGWLAVRALAVSTSGVAVFWVARGLGAAGLAAPLLRALALAVVVAAVSALAQAYGLALPLFAEARAPGGLLGNRNSVGHFAALGFPVVVFAALRAERFKGAGLGAVGAALAVAALVLTRSRAAWLGLAVVAAVLVVGLLFVAWRYRAWRLPVRFALVLIVAGTSVAAALVLPNALVWASDDPYRETAQNVLNYEAGSGQGRLVQYRTSLGMAWDDPLLGAGPGNWPVAYPAHAAPGDPSMSGEAGRTTNPWPSSDLVAVVSERGLLGALLLALAWAGLALGALRRLRRSATEEEALRAVALLALLGGALVVGTFDAVLLLPWPTLLFWAAAGALWVPEATPTVRLAPWVRAAVLGALALGAGLAAVRSTGQIAAMAYYTADDSFSDLERAARLDPGNYRLRLRLAQRGGDRETRCRHALAAHALFPHAAAAERLAGRCE